MSFNDVDVVKPDYNRVLRIILGAIYKYKKFNILFVSLVAISSVFYALSIPNTYQSVALLKTSDSNSSGISGMLGDLGGVASLAGINLGGGNEKSVFHIEEKLKSRDFLIPFINKHDLKKDLFAAINWDRSSNKIIYDNEVFDVNTNKWVRKVEPPKSIEPSDEETFKRFRELLKVTYERKKDIFKVSIDFYSPDETENWLNKLIKDFNEYEREVQIEEVKRNLNFLNSYLEKSEYTELKSSLYELIEEQLKKLMVSESRDDFALEVIQAPYIPEEKESPKRGVICIGLTLLGGLFSLLISVVLFLRNR